MEKKEKKRIKREVDKNNIGENPRSNLRESAIRWEAPDFEYNPKDVSWYWLSLMIGIVLLAVAVWQKNFLFGIFVVIAWFLVVNLAGRRPSLWEFELTEKGLEIRQPGKIDSPKKFYALADMEGFDIHEVSAGGYDYKELILKIKSKFTPLVKITIPSSKEKKIEEFLAKFIPRKEYEESMVDSLSKLIRF
ncbi:hypothetical protein HYV91_00985 [Candidatus Wolfebacteria bacterium]|nr:hypothetical protein [Candidatus Wolfebacteria bacterium]